MINYRYQLVSPRKIVKKIFDEDPTNKVVVKPLYMSICAADQRYFQGKRNSEILAQKLPMSLIHESVGEVILDETKSFKPGDNVIMLPCIVRENSIDENYLPHNQFMSSSIDGFMQQHVIISPNQLIKLDNSNLEVSTLLELLSVAIHSVESYRQIIEQSNSIGIWGDGNLGYLIHLYIAKTFPKKKIIVFGKTDEKLEVFGSASKRVNILKQNKLPEVDVGFEVVGGMNSSKVINQIIDTIAPNGTIYLLGVSEDPILINTRTILEKGLVLIGRSRSTKQDFILANKFLSNRDNVNLLKKIIVKTFEVSSIKNIEEAFDYDYTHPWKTIIKWCL